MSLADFINIGDLRCAARKRLPRPVFDYLDGGAEDEVTLRRNIAAFGDYELLPDALVDVSDIDTRTRLFGRDIALPLLLGPTGLSRLFHSAGERAVVRAAAAAGIPYALSTLSTTSIEDVAQEASGPKLFQLYVFKDRGLTRDLVRRARAANYDALILTVDTAVAGNRERDRRNALTVPPKITPRTFVEFARRPGWSIRALSKDRFDLVNMRVSLGAEAGGGYSLFEFVGKQLDSSVSWRDLEQIAAEWQGPLAVKGIVTASDARRAAENGASAVMISNHGGRQLDGAPAPVDQIAEVADSVGGTLEIILDGGVRRGSDILKALALGASACSVGRPYLYGLTAGGEAGVGRAISIFREEFARALALGGIVGVGNVESRHVRLRRGAK